MRSALGGETLKFQLSQKGVAICLANFAKNGIERSPKVPY